MGAEKLACIGGLLCARHLRGIDAFNLHDNRIPGRGNRGSGMPVACQQGSMERFELRSV